jgi:hypothetical protein
METENEAKKIKLAILLYGQPRFFEYTYKNIQEAYTIDGCETDFFAHFWEDVGFHPGDDYTDTYVNTKDKVKECLIDLGAKNYIQEDYTELDLFSDAQKIVYGFLTQSRIRSINNTRGRYHYGQHLSLYKCFSLMEKFERRKNFKYDIVIKVRSDWIYSPSDSITKYKTYIEKLVDTNSKRLTTLSLKKYDLHTNTEHHLTNLNCKKSDLHGCIVSISDIFINCNRSAAKYVFKDWLFYYNYLQCIYTYNTSSMKNVFEEKEKTYNKTNQILGDICMLNDIEAYKHSKSSIKIHRLMLKDKCKKKWVNSRRRIVLPDLNCNISEYIEQALHENK